MKDVVDIQVMVGKVLLWDKISGKAKITEAASFRQKDRGCLRIAGTGLNAAVTGGITA